MKIRILIRLSLIFLISAGNHYSFAENTSINPKTARAYEGYLLTFMWPAGQSEEQVRYEEILSTENITRLENPQDTITSSTSKAPAEISMPFAKYRKQLGSRVKILSNQQWTLIFKKSGDSIKKSFYSEQTKDGYPELTGDIKIKLGRYLESNINYQHYLFDSATLPDTAKQEETSSNNSSFISQSTNPASSQPNLKGLEPSFVLLLEHNNKTASKKLNYLDHPTIGTLLYFEPISLEEAVDRITLQSTPPETGASLNYDKLQSTNELSNTTINSPKTATSQAVISPPVVFD